MNSQGNFVNDRARPSRRDEFVLGNDRTVICSEKGQEGESPRAELDRAGGLGKSSSPGIKLEIVELPLGRHPPSEAAD